MPHPNPPARATLARLALFAVLGWALVALARRHGDAEKAETLASPADDAVDRPQAEWTVERSRPKPRTTRRRLATSFVFTTLFFAGAAFSAGAGDLIVQAVEGDCDAPVAEMTAEEAEVCEAEVAEAAGEEPAAGENEASPDTPEAGEEPVEGEAPGDGSSEEPGSEPDAGDGEDPDAGADPGDDAGSETGGGEVPAGDGDEAPVNGGADSNGGGEAKDGEPVGEPILEQPAAVDHAAAHEHDELDPEASLPGTAATVWLHRDLGDPLPVARRLAPGFARMLAAEARRLRVDWAVVLAAVRAHGGVTRWPASRKAVRETGRKVRTLLRTSSEWEAFLALEGRTAYADRATALAHYNRAVGLRALVTGFAAAKDELERKVLADARLDIYAGGRSDVASGNIDVRVLVLMRYLAEAYGQVTVSSLHSGHRVYARPGVVSAHVYGLAVDIAALAGQPILGNSAPGGVAEQAVRDILLLPNELRPRQVISLLGLGGPSFPMNDHADHIHVGF